MGIIKNLFSRKKRIKDEEPLELQLETEVSETVGDDETKEVTDAIANVCQRFIDATYHIEDLRVEYESVSNYFEDTQRIEQMPENLRGELNDIAAKIEFLERNQEEYKQLRSNLSEDKYRIMARYEKEVPALMRQLVDLETRMTAIQRDMQYLEGEKDTQDFYAEEAEDHQRQLRSIAISVAGMGVVTFIAFFWLAYMYSFEMQIPGMITLFVITLVFVLLYLRYRHEEYEIKMAQNRKKRAVSLLNKVKIKYVNNKSTLDFIYEKYQIRSLRELEHIWEQYTILVQETKKFHQRIGDMRVYVDEMEKLLRDVGVLDPYIWSQQTAALLDNREMVEVKHELNMRRQAVRAKMEENESIKQESLLIMKGMVLKEPALMDTIRDLLSAYHIEF